MYKIETLKYAANQHYIMSEETAFPKAAIVRLLKSTGIERVSSDAVIVMDKKLSNMAITWAKEANKLATHAKRSTVRAEDIELASTQ